MTVEQELIAIFASTSGQRNRDIIVGYYGWEEGRTHTLTEIGAQFGITRERVRQICSKLVKRIANPSAVSAPVLDAALDWIAAGIPAPAAQLEAEMLNRGWTAVGLTLENLAVAAELLGRPVRFQTVNVPGGTADRPADVRLAVRPEQIDAVAAIVDLAKKEVYFHGLSRVETIERAVAEAKNARGVGELVRQTLQLMDGFRWLDEESGWFRLLPIRKHGLPKAVDKILSVAGSVEVSRLRAALGRNRRLWKHPPPEKVLLEFCKQMPGVRVEGGRLAADPPLDWRKTLTGVEAALVEVLLEHGPVMERGAMEDLCVARGMNRFSFHAFVSWSPVIAQYGHSIYGLLGTEVSPQQVEELLAQRRPGRADHRVLDHHGLTEDGKVRLGYRLSKAASTYAVITVPAALKKIVRGRFQLLDDDGRPVGTLATKDGRAWGLGSFLRRRNARIGDRILLTLDPQRRTASVTWETHDI